MVLKELIGGRRGAILFGCAIAMGCGVTPLVLQSFGAFVKPLIEEFGGDRSNIAMIATVHVLITMIVIPFAGRLIDRFGVVPVASTSFALFGVTIIGIGAFATSLNDLVLGYGLLAVVAAGCSPIAFTKVIAAWFDQSRGLALGLGLTGVAAGAAISPVFATSLIEAFGWRGAYVGIGVVALVLGMPVVLLLISERSRTEATDRTSTDPSLRTIPTMAVLRSGQLWLMTGAFTCVGITYAAADFHLIPMLTDKGASASMAANAAALLGVSSVVGRVCTGPAIDRMSTVGVAVVAVTVLGIGVSLLFCLSYWGLDCRWSLAFWAGGR